MLLIDLPSAAIKISSIEVNEKVSDAHTIAKIHIISWQVRSVSNYDLNYLMLYSLDSPCLNPLYQLSCIVIYYINRAISLVFWPHRIKSL